MMNLWQQLLTLSSDFRRLSLLLIVCGGALAACSHDADYQRLTGATMGTYYSIVAKCASGVSAEDLQVRIDDELAAVNSAMSTYDPDSVLSHFNNGPVGEWQLVSEDLITVVSASREMSELSGGAFDVTVGPLVNAWGFGPNTPVDHEPSAQTVHKLMQSVGFEKLQIREHPAALRKSATIYVDLSAIAKGHGVDRVAELLHQADCASYLVDIGGEVAVSGTNPRGGSWTIGVEVPLSGSQGEVQRVLRLSDQSVATSGDYRNFRTVGDQRLSHTIDPRTGRPVAHGLASVTVVHPSAMWADGLATAISVLGPDDGLELARSIDLPVLMIIRANEEFEERYTDAMRQYLVNP